MRTKEEAISEVTDEILILGLVLILGVAIMAMVFGMIQLTPRTPYLAANFSYQQVSGNPVILIRHLGGDELTFSGAAAPLFPAEIYIDIPSRRYQAVPDPATGTFRAGDAIYVYYTGSGFALTPNLAMVSAHSLPSRDLRVSIVDTRSNILILGWGSLTYGTDVTAAITATPNPTVTVTPVATTSIAPTITVNSTATATPAINATQTVTATPTANVTPTATTTPSATATVTATSTATATATTTTATRTITVIWSPSTYGYGSLSPPTPLANSAEVKIPRGSSKTIYFVPNPGRAVVTITLDGATVYTGSSIGTTIAYTVTNVIEDRTLIAKFG